MSTPLPYNEKANQYANLSAGKHEPANLEEILRSIVQVGTSGPAHEEAYLNWCRLSAYNLKCLTTYFDFNSKKRVQLTEVTSKHIKPEWLSPAQHVYWYVTSWVTQFSQPVEDSEANSKNQVTCEMPDLSQVQQSFENDDMIEVVDFIKTLKTQVPRIRTNFISLLVNARENEQSFFLIDLARTVVSVATSGRMLQLPGDVKPRLYKGPRDAHLINEIGQAELSGMIEGDGWGDPDDFTQPIEPTVFILPHFLISVGRPTGLIGYANSSKTFLAIELAIAVAAGLPTAWGGCDVTRQGGVIHLDYEMGRQATRQRYQRVMNGLGVDPKRLWQSGNLKIYPHPSMKLTSPGVERLLNSMCDGKALCIIDSFRAATPDGTVDENSSATRTYLDMLSRVSDKTGCVFMVIHHEKKSQPGGDPISKMQMMRGSSGLADAFGTTVHIERASDGRYFSIIQGKVSEGIGGSAVRYTLGDIGPYNSRYQKTEGLVIKQVEETVEDVETSLERGVLSVVGGLSTIAQITDALKQAKFKTVRKQTLCSVITSLKERGLIERVKEGSPWCVVTTSTQTAEDLLS